jgi:hypothetical protein
MTMSSWEELTEQLAARLPRLEIDDVIILIQEAGNRYTQLIQLKNGLALEAVANVALPQDGQLTVEQERELQRKGWQPPERPRHNWWHEVNKWPLHSRDAASIAELMVSTLRDVYRVASPSDIEVRSFRA